MKPPKIKLKIPFKLHEKILKDLKRRHSFAYERIGFIFSNSKKVSNDLIIITFTDYQSVKDENYIKAKDVGAKINSAAIREAMQEIHDKNRGCFHVHLHNHNGFPTPSDTDIKGGVPEIVESFLSMDSQQAHGIIILSEDSFYIRIKINGFKQFIIPELISVIGYPMQFIFSKKNKLETDDVYIRQSFLGKDAQSLFRNVAVGIVGFGGGGSHIGQQLAHIGVKKIIIFDNDKIEISNLNRLIGGWFSDIKKATNKTDIAKRLIKKIFPKSKLTCVNDVWQNKSEILQQCDIVIGCVDSLIGRKELEAECRRYLIPYIDIGMDVYTIENKPYMSGQIILSMPGMSCLSCMSFLTEKNLANEGAKYGDVGGLPQVVWPNGVLASTAVGIAVDLITGWTNQSERKVYLSYDGNLGLITNNERAKYTDENCLHYPIEQSGPPKFKKI